MRILKYFAIGLVAISLGACANSGMGPKQTGGTVLGAIAGGVAGSQFGSGSGRLIATGIGTLLGAAVGNNIGQSLDRADRQYLHNASYQAFETGNTQRWNNPQSGHYGVVDPAPAYQSGNNYCREYQQTIYIDGEPQTGTGTACRQPDGTWRIAG